MAQQTIATAYVAIRPSVEGIGGEIQKAMDKAMPQINKSIGKSVSQAAKNAAAGSSSAFQNIGSIATNSASQFSQRLGSGLKNAATSSGQILKDSLQTAIGTASIGIGAIAGQAVAGGLSRATGFNDATAKLKALGIEGQKLTSVMDAVKASVDGTSYSLPEATKTATTLMAAGITDGKQLEDTLKRTTKLADMTGASFDEMGYLMAKNAASGTLYAEDLNQFLERGVDISTAIGKQIGKSNVEVKKMASEGQISFQMLQDAVDGMDFDSVLYASLSVKKSFGNLRTSISKMGQTLWQPLIDSSPKVFMTLKEGFDSLQKNQAFTDLMNRINTSTSSMMDTIQRFAEKMKEAFSSKTIVGDFIDKLKNVVSKTKELLSGGEAIAAGGILGAIGKLLSSIPILGGVFGRLTVPVGLVLGLFVTLTKNSEAFTGLLTNIGKSASSFGKSFLSSFKNGVFAPLDQLGQKGSGVESFISKISGLFNPSNFADAGKQLGLTIQSIGTDIASHKQDFVDVFNTIKDAIKGGMDTLKEVTNSDTNAEAIGKSISGIVKGITTTISAIVPLAVEIGKVVGQAATSDISKSIFSGVVDIAKYFTEHENVLKAGLAIAAGIFVGGKLAKIVGAASKFMSSFKGKNSSPGTKDSSNPLTGIANVLAQGIESLTPIISAVGKVGISIVQVIGNLGRAIVTSMAGIGQAAVAGAPYLAAFAALLVGLGGTIALLDKMSVFDVLDKIAKNLIDNGIKILDGASGVAIKIGGFITDSIVKTLSSLSENLPSITGALGDFVNVLSGSFSDTMGALGTLTGTLATQGILAGAGAVALAGGLTALVGSLVALAGTNTISKIPILGDKEGILGNITEITSSLSNFSNSIPSILATSTGEALNSGVRVIESFTSGMTQGLGNTQTTLQRQVDDMLKSIQANLNAKPLEIKIKTSSGTSGIGGNAKIFNYNIRTTNSTNLDNLLARAR